MPEKDNNLENIVEPDITIEYIFIERAANQVKPINDDQGYSMGFFNLFTSGEFKNDNVLAFKTQLLQELNYSVKTYDHFTSEAIDLSVYKYGLVDNDRIVTEFIIMDEAFFKAMVDSLRNLMIVGANFNIEKFKTHELFNQWFDNYTNRI